MNQRVTLKIDPHAVPADTAAVQITYQVDVLLEQILGKRCGFVLVWAHDSPPDPRALMHITSNMETSTAVGMARAMADKLEENGGDVIATISLESDEDGLAGS